MFVASLAWAQVDTGGGVGGTGARREADLVSPAGGSAPDTCDKSNSVGIFELKDKNTQRVLRKEYACRGQLLEVGSNELLELYLRTGEKIIALENSAIVIE
jgi:hypothetical protein